MAVRAQSGRYASPGGTDDRLVRDLVNQSQAETSACGDERWVTRRRGGAEGKQC